MISKQTLFEDFKKIFKEEPDQVYFSPGRVNLIGEHIDYHGGLVFPAAIQLGTYGVIKQRKDLRFRFFSKQFPESGIATIESKNLSYTPSHGWVNYMKGVIDVCVKKGIKVHFGLDIYIDSDLPKASGLSSSASIEMLMAFILKESYQLPYTRTELALIAQEAERQYLGVQSGIMDQLSIALGKKEHALLMNTSTLEVTYHPLDINPYMCVIMNTNYQRTLQDSKYNERVIETFKASEILSDHYKHTHLTELDLKDLNNYRNILNDDVLFKRIKHIVTEQQRTLQFKDALEHKNTFLLATYLNASHKSLKEDYEVTGKHLDLIVEAALKYAIGARMTGAGFGGCAIAIIDPTQYESMIEYVTSTYTAQFGFSPSFYPVELSDGVRIYE